MMGKKILRSCTAGCGSARMTRSLMYRCNDCRRHRYWHVDTDEYNSNIDCNEKQMTTCECGHKYIRWNRSQHTRTIHHQQFIRSDFRPTTAHMCQKKGPNGRIHGRWSERSAASCPKCVVD